MSRRLAAGPLRNPVRFLPRDDTMLARAILYSPSLVQFFQMNAYSELRKAEIYPLKLGRKKVRRAEIQLE